MTDDATPLPNIAMMVKAAVMQVLQDQKRSGGLLAHEDLGQLDEQSASRRSDAAQRVIDLLEPVQSAVTAAIDAAKRDDFPTACFYAERALRASSGDIRRACDRALVERRKTA